MILNSLEIKEDKVRFSRVFINFIDEMILKKSLEEGSANSDEYAFLIQH